VLGMLEKVSKDISEYVERSEKEEEQRKEEIELEFKNQLSEARRKLSEARDFKLNIDPLKSIMRAAVKKGSEGEYEDGMEKIEKIFEKFELLKPISEKIEQGKNLIRELRDNDLDYNKYIRELKKGKLKTDQGDYQESLSVINEVISDIKYDLEDAELDKDIPSPEEIELEVEEELKKAEGKEETEEEVESEKEIELEEDIPSAEEIEAEIEAEIDAELKEAEEKVSFEEDLEEPVTEETEFEEAEPEREFEEVSIERGESEEIADKELYMEDIENLTSELHSLIKIAKENDYSLESGKDIIDKASESTKRENYETAYDLLREGKEKAEDEVEGIIEESVLELELTLEEVGEEIDIEDIRSNLSEIQDRINEGQYETAMDLLKNVEEKHTPVEGPDVETQKKISGTEEILKDAEYVGIDVDQAMELLEEARKEKKVGNYIEAEDLAEDAKENILTLVPDFMTSKVSKAKKELMRAKIVGTDVSKPIDLLKQANFAKKNEDFEDCLHYIKMFEEEMSERKG
ncbi:MAG: hypothetical protein ACOC1V_07660, partial [Candidatus Saliniplasma sp.]